MMQIVNAFKVKQREGRTEIIKGIEHNIKLLEPFNVELRLFDVRM